MNLLATILGQLPASDSVGGKLGKIDFLKLLRMGIILAASYCAVAVVEKLMHDVTGGAFGIPTEFTTPITGVLALILDALRRTMASPAI